MSKNQIEKLVKSNALTERFGLKLSGADAQELMEHRFETLRRERRIEFGEGVLDKLIYAFCDSPFIYQENYVETIEGLQEIFYNYKNQFKDMVSDDELIEVMENYFDGKCQGSLDLLEEELWINRSNIL